ncbi:MAG: GTPase HflX [Clostridiales bacterium]|jgi:GTP-binding protein HflX|nr:GTPase HflX [Clostridiales bacterium]
MPLRDTMKTKEKAVLFGVRTGNRGIIDDCTDDSMEELALLADTAGAEVLGVFVQNRPAADRATYVGEGKAEEIRLFCEENGAGLAVCDDELSGMQVRNLENALGTRVIDRSALIMDIFAQSAKTREGQLQVELAQLRYFLPRLTGSFTGMSRQAGGGGIGGARRGPGETKLETDRRHIRSRIQAVVEQLREVERHRATQRRQRVKEGIQQIAIVGYTNAGKSTLLNRLTDAGVLARDSLFATLDPTAKKLTLPDGTNALLIDTVGLIRKLPHHLIKAFKSTLEEAVGADVLLHVADASSSQLAENLAVVEDLLTRLGAADKPIVTAFNKTDLPRGDSVPQFRAGSVNISAKTGAGVDALLHALCGAMPEQRKRVTVLVPYGEGNLVSLLHETALVKNARHTENGTLLDVVVDSKGLAIVSDYIV